MDYQHTPVMLKEVLEYLKPQPGQLFIDCTLGGGGYTFAIAKRIRPKGKIVSIDLDKLAIRNSKAKIQENKNKNIILVHGNFKNLYNIIKECFPEKYKTAKFAGIVFDLGLSQAQLKDRNRGFSFQLDAPLNMSFRQQEADSRKQTTGYIINELRENELEKIIREYGEEKYARRIAKAIAEAREKKTIKTTGELVEIIKKAVPARYLHNRIHFATRTFQALRIATNNELDNLKKALPQAVNLLAKKGRVVIVSYHSLEDRIVKHFFKKESRDCLCPPELPVCRCDHRTSLKIITKKIIKPSAKEIEKNSKARSAKMRVAEKI